MNAYEEDIYKMLIEKAVHKGWSPWPGYSKESPDYILKAIPLDELLMQPRFAEAAGYDEEEVKAKKEAGEDVTQYLLDQFYGG